MAVDLKAVLVPLVASIVLMIASSWLVLLNGKLVKHGFPYPMALAGAGMAFSSCASFLCCKVFRIVESRRLPTEFYLRKALPVGLFMSLTLYLSNIAYLFLTVSFISMLKAIMPAITMIGLFLAGLETPTRRLILSILLLAFGTLLSSVGEVNFSFAGLVIVLLALSADATRLVMTQLLLVGLKFHPIEGLLHLAPTCTLLLFTGSAVFELSRMRSTGAFEFVRAQPHLFLATAVLGFFVNWLNYVVIKSASALTLKVLGPIKNALVVFSGMVFLNETVTLLQLVGYGISTAAFFWYSMIKMQQSGGSKV